MYIVPKDPSMREHQRLAVSHRLGEEVFYKDAGLIVELS